ncbi:MAG: hypothetical protein JWP91_1292 [Fibrobacteres bacterium]|nr:hypothetical protein [Fibrobacterota bacterium]
MKIKRIAPGAGGKKPAAALFAKAAMALMSLGLFQCELKTVYQPKFPETSRFRVFHLGTYSSKLDEEKEIEGTIFQTTLSFDMERKAPGWILRRKLDTLVARGYHKFSMPNELEKKVDLELTMDSAMIPVRIDGYDSLKAILGRIQQKEEYRKQLLAGSDTAKYRAEWRDWWRMCHFLPHGVEIEARQALPVDALNKSLETLKADSARFDGARPRLKKSCLDYTLYYHRTDSLSLLMEQFYFSGIQNRKYRKYDWHPSVVLGILQYSVEAATGMPCFASKTESSDLELTLKGETARTPVHLYRYEEDIYEY